MDDQSSSEGGLRARTRRAILDAAMAVLAADPHASLAQVAAAAEVGRSTLHRYFSERNDLVRALSLHVHELSTAAIERAEPDCGPAVAALRRVIEGQLDLGPIVPLVYNDWTLFRDENLTAILDTGDEAIVEVLDRVAVRGAAQPQSWPRLVFWALLDAGYRAAKDGAPRVQIVDAIMASLTRGTIETD